MKTQFIALRSVSFDRAYFPEIASRLRCVGRYNTPSAAVGVIGAVCSFVRDSTSSVLPAFNTHKAPDSVPI